MIATGAKKIKVGAPLDDATEVGPINNRTQYDHIMKMIASGVQAGATLVAGSAERSSGGYFVSPTVLSNVTNQMDVARTGNLPVRLSLQFPSIPRKKPLTSRMTPSLVWPVQCGRTTWAGLIG